METWSPVLGYARDGYRATKILISKFYLIRQLEILVCSILESGKGTYGRIRVLH